MLMAVASAVLTVAAFVVGYLLGADIEVQRDRNCLVRFAAIVEWNEGHRCASLWRVMRAMQRGEHRKLKARR